MIIHKLIIQNLNLKLWTIKMEKISANPKIIIKRREIPTNIIFQIAKIQLNISCLVILEFF